MEDRGGGRRRALGAVLERGTRMTWAIGFGLLLSLGTVACGDPVGTPCEITGSGFHAQDPCRYQCLSRWQLTCPGDLLVSPGLCTGAFGCEPGSCPAGQVCYHDDDPFEDRSFCVPDTVCGELSAQELSQWEHSSLEGQREVIEDREAREARRQAWRETRAADAGGAEVSSDAEAEAASSVELNRALDVAADAEPLAPLEAENPGRTVEEAPPLPCEATSERAAATIALSELAAGELFSEELPYGWRLVLDPVEGGWVLRVLDRRPAEGAVDLSAVTPPWRVPTNPRQILGWHFRNAENTAANEGEVNAPQLLRLFQFDPQLTGSLGFEPVAGAEPPSAPGRGWLRIEAMELSPPARGERATIERLEFRACLTWPRPSAADEDRWRRAVAVGNPAADAESINSAAGESESLAYEELDRELLGSCDLETAGISLDARVAPVSWQLDLDGDETFDLAMQGVRSTDGARGIVLCRGGTWLDFVASSHPLAAQEAVASSVAQMEAWWVVEGDHGAFGFEGEPPWPSMAGQALVIERVEKSRVLLYWSEDALQTQVIYRFVEP